MGAGSGQAVLMRLQRRGGALQAAVGDGRIRGYGMGVPPGCARFRQGGLDLPAGLRGCGAGHGAPDSGDS